MKFKSIADFFPVVRDNRYSSGSRPQPDMSKAKWQELTEDTNINGISFAKGSRYKVFETTNFGWVVFGPESKTVDGMKPGRRIFKW